MKCLDTERLIGYAYHLLDERAASQVRAHLGECPRCRESIEPYGRLDTVLNEWKVATPTPGFDARVRQAVEAQKTQGGRWAFWGLDWARGSALAALGVFLILATVWATRAHYQSAHLSGVTTRLAHHAMPAPAANQVAKLQSSAGMAHGGAKAEETVPKIRSSRSSSNDDSDAQAIEDYDLAANFDLLSELPKGETRVAN